MSLIDSTLREGEQMAGVYFSLPQKLEIVRLLGQLGIEEIELGVAVRDPEMGEMFTQARNLAPKARLSLWCRCIASDITLSALFRPDVLSISVPISDIHIQKRLRKDREWVLDHISSAVDLAGSEGIEYISLGFEDATRADEDFLASAYEHAVAAGANRIRFSDTMGLASASDIIELASKYAGKSDIEIGIHTHNDFGMATANALTALESGFHWADGSVIGLGERAGIARLEELVAFLKIKQSHSHYDTTVLQALSKTVATAANISIYRHHPVIGDGIFQCESGIHLDGIAKDPCTYEPYEPDMVGASRTQMMGKKIGHNALSNKLNDLGVPVSKRLVDTLLSAITQQSRLEGRPLSEREIRHLIALTRFV